MLIMSYMEILHHINSVYYTVAGQDKTKQKTLYVKGK